LRQLRELNPKARIIVHAERLDEVPHLYGAGASYVLTPRLLEASHVMEIMVAAEKDLLHEKREQHKESVAQRDEVVP
jgi:quinolinate synthase